MNGLYFIITRTGFLRAGQSNNATRLSIYINKYSEINKKWYAEKTIQCKKLDLPSQCSIFDELQAYTISI